MQQDIRKVLAREAKRNFSPMEEVEKEQQEKQERCCPYCRLGVQASWCDCGCTYNCSFIKIKTFDIEEESSDDEEELLFKITQDSDSFEIINKSDYNKNPRYSVIRSCLRLQCIYDGCIFTEGITNIFRKKHKKAEYIVVDNFNKNKSWMCSDCYEKRWHKKITEA